MTEKTLMYPKFSRNIAVDYYVDYYQIDDGNSRITSHVVDHQHDIVVNLQVSVPDMIVRDAEVEFIRYPVPDCLKMCGERMRAIIGLSLSNIPEAKRRLADAYLWEGCNQVYVLAISALGPFVFFHGGSLVNEGKLGREEWKKMVAVDYKGNCIAH